MEIQTARKWYRWLWMSPLLTVPTLLILFFAIDSLVYDLVCPQGWQSCSYDYRVRYLLSAPIAVLGSALWHLVLLIPARDKESTFVRWHGRQELLLAGLRTAVPLASIVVFGGNEAFFSIIIMIPIWLFGTLWGQRQAARGDCSLMRWTGKADFLPGPPPDKETGKFQDLSTETLENTFRFSNDPQERQAALEELKNRGVVENT